MRYKKGMLITAICAPVVMVQSVGQHCYHCLDISGTSWYVPFEAAKLANPSAPISTIGEFK